MMGSPVTSGRGKAVADASRVEASGSSGGAPVTPQPTAAAATRSEDGVSEMMGRLRLTVAEDAAVVLDDGADEISVHSKWTLIGKVLSPTILHISTISSALRPAWGNPRRLLLNPGGDNIFVAEFATKGDMDRVLDGPPWVVGKHAVLLQGFNIDLRPRDMIFYKLKVWVTILNLPFGYMQKWSGTAIASSIGVDGSIPGVGV
ncbi:hypothetical protein ACQ4PT_022424 [Festuca glaucescens]